MSVNTSECFFDVFANGFFACVLDMGVFACVAFPRFEFLVIGKRLVDVKGNREADGVIADELRVGVFGFPGGDDAEGVEAGVFELHVGIRSVSVVDGVPNSFAVEVVVQSIGVVWVAGIASEPARREAGGTDAGVGHPGVEPRFDNGQSD